MQITTLTFGLTKNLGNYQTARIDIEAQVEPWEDWQRTLQRLKVQLLMPLGLDITI